MQTEKMRAFILHVLYWCIIAGLIYVCAKYLLPALAPFVIGFCIAFLLKPLINHLTKTTQRARRLVAACCLTVFYVLAATLLIVLGTRLVIFLQDTIALLPGIFDSYMAPALDEVQLAVEHFVSALDPMLLDFISSAGQSIDQTLSGLVMDLSKGALSIITGLAGSLPAFVMNYLLTVISSFFCTMDYYTITSFFARLLPQKARSTLFAVKRSGVDILLKFGKAYALLLMLTFAELLIGLTLLKVQYAFLLSAVIALVDILPVLGTGTVLVPWALGALITGNGPLGAGLLILYAIIGVVRQTLEPRVVGQQIGLYPLVTLISMFLGAKLFGFAGLFGLPVAVTIFVQLQRTGKDQSASTDSAQL